MLVWPSRTRPRAEHTIARAILAEDERGSIFSASPSEVLGASSRPSLQIAQAELEYTRPALRLDPCALRLVDGGPRSASASGRVKKRYCKLWVLVPSTIDPLGGV